MSVELRQLRGRVEAQERITQSLCVSFGEVTDRLQEITATMATKEDIKQLSESVDSRFKQVDDRLTQLSESVDSRFEHVYGALSDIQANVGEVRNILAMLVGRLEQR